MIPFGDSGEFRPVTGVELRRRAVRGAAATLSAATLSLAFRVVATVVLARLLTPADFGLVTMVTTFSLLLVSFGINGFTEAVIQFEKIDHFTASNLFWLNSGVALALSIMFATAGSWLARFYGNPLVASVAAVLSLGILFSAASVIHLSLLKRALRFTSVSSNEIAALAVYTVVTILLAIEGWRYWSLVAGIIAQQLSVTIGSWWLCRWVPGLPRRTGKTIPMVRFAAQVYGKFCILYSTQNIDNLLIGWRFHAISLGFYKKAYDLFALSASQLTAPLHNVALATLSRLKNDPARFRRYLTKSLAIIAFVGMAVSADLTLVGKDLVRLLLGAQWSQSGRIFQLFAPGIGVMLLCSMVGWIHLSIGKPGRWLRWSLVELTLTVSLFVPALFWGPAGIAAAWSASYWLLLVPGFWYAGRPIGFGVSSFIAAVWRFAAAALVAGAATAAIIRHTMFLAYQSTAYAALEATAIITALFVGLYLLAVIALHRGVAPLKQFAALSSELMPARKSAE